MVGSDIPPVLLADTTGNFPKTNLDILFTDDSTWRNAVTAVKVDGSPLTVGTQYDLSAGKLRLKTSTIPAMQSASTYSVTLEATGYQTAVISQPVAAGLSGSGTAVAPVMGATAPDLGKVRHYVAVPGLYFRQTADIDLNNIDWQPIGVYDQTLVTEGEPFMANYNGNDYYIENMKIADNSQTYKSGSGLFSHTKEAGLSNIGLKGVDIDVPNTGSVGALVGEAIETSITNCVVENSTKVKGLHSVGGLIGYAHQSTISSSSADVRVIGETSSSTITHKVGGFIGNSGNNTITGSSAHGIVTGIKEIGGFVGYMNHGTITGCFADGNVAITGDYAQDTGGFVGLNYHAKADQCYAISTVSGRNYVGGFAGRNIGTITNSYARGSVAYTGTVAGGFVGRIQNNAANILGGSPSDTSYNYSDVAISGSGTTIGAFLGEHDTSAPGGSGTIQYNHYNSGIAAVNQGGGANGLTLENMKKLASFPEWNFTTIWSIQEDVTAPYHRWETEPPVVVPEKSVYDILFDPTGVVAGVAKEVEFTLKSVEVKDEGYELVRVNVAVTEQPNNSHVALTGNYGAGSVDVIALGYWGPETGHLVSRDYDMSYNLMAYFTTPGQYTIAITLKDMQENLDIATKNVTLTVAEAPVTTHTLALTGEGIVSIPTAGNILEKTQVVITVTPPVDKQVATFTVNGVNQKAALMTAPMHQYEFSITEDTTVVVTYEDIPAGNFRLNLLVSPSGGGWAVIHDGNVMTTTGTFAAGTTVPVGCMPAAGYAFDNWTVEGHVVSTFGDFDFIMPADYTNLRANFISTNLSAPPALVADTTDNYAGQNLMITFSDGQAWANAITEISVEGEVLSLMPDNIQYYLNAGDAAVDGQISLYGSKINAFLSPGSKEIRVKSTGYADAVVMQDITATYFDRAEFTTQPVGPVENGGLLTTQPVVTLYDTYNNPCTDGPSSTREITLQAKTGSGWTLGGTVAASAVNGVVTFTNLTVTNPSGLAITDAQLMYEVVGSPNKYFYSESFTIPGATGLAAPTLTADTTGNYAGNNITITLSAGDWADWNSAISAVKVDSVSLTEQQYNIGITDLRFITDEISIMQTPGTYTITVEASGYNNAVVSQSVTAGPQASAAFTTQPQGPSISGGQLQQQPVVTLYDTYGNLCADGPSSSASITLQRAVGNSWTLGGISTVTAANGVASFTNLTATNPSSASITDARMGYTYQGVTTYSNDFNVPGLGSQTAPVLTADTTDNYAGNIIEITFVDDPAWRGAVDSVIIVKDGTNQILNSPGVSLAEGKLTLDTSQLSWLQERDPAGVMISIAALNYETTWVYQPMTSGIAASIIVDTEPQGPVDNGGVFQSAPVISLYDAYNNKCIDGPSSGTAVTAAKLDTGNWSLGGTTTTTASQGTVTFGDLSATNNTGGDITNAQLRFTLDGIAVTDDSAVFIIPFGFTLTLIASPESGGTATIDAGGSSGLLLAEAAIAVTASASQDYEFVNWTVGDTQVSDQESFTYTMPAANTTLRANFQPAGTLTPPPLTPDTSDNYAGEVIWLVLPEGPIFYDYVDAIYAVQIGGTTYNKSDEPAVFDYSYEPPNYILRLFTGNIPLLQTKGTYVITVKATGYSDAAVTQVITATRIHTDECTTLTGPVQGATYSSGQSLPEIKLQLRDKYGNALIDGPDAGRTFTAEIPQGYGGACTLSGTLTASADANGQVNFENIVVNLSAGVQQDSVTLKFTGISSLGYEVVLYISESETGNWIVFTVAK